MALPIVLRGGPNDGSKQGQEFAFGGPEDHPETIEMPGGMINKGVWRSSVYRRAEEGVDGYAPCMFYDWSHYVSGSMQERRPTPHT